MNKHEEMLIKLLAEILKDKELAPLLSRKKAFVDTVLYMEHILTREESKWN